MLATVGRSSHIGHAGFAFKSCAQRFRSKQSVFLEMNLGQCVPCDGPCRCLDAALAQQIGATSWTGFIEPETGTRLAPANPRKQKSQQALTC